MSLSRDEENQIRKAIEAIEEENILNILKGDEAAAAHLWADDLILNAPNNQVLRKPQILERTKQHIALQYSSWEQHREAMLLRRDCVVTMGYEVIVQKGDVPNSGKTIKRRYTNVHYFEEGRWRLVARQTTDISAQ
jgi:hypothetical protein